MRAAFQISILVRVTQPLNSGGRAPGERAALGPARSTRMSALERLIEIARRLPPEKVHALLQSFDPL
jgi:hypothetical protein